MTIRVVSARRWLVIAAIALSVSACPVRYGNDDVVDPGQHSAFTREDLRTYRDGAERSPVLVPARLPAGAEEMDGGGFSLNSVGTDPVRHPSRRSWVSDYDSDVLGGSFRIFQRPAHEARQEPCGPRVGQPFIQRRVGDVVLAICSSDFSSGNREYWDSVTFTGDLEEVGWLKG